MLLTTPGSTVGLLGGLRYRITTHWALVVISTKVGGGCSRLGYSTITDLGVSSSLDGVDGMDGMGGIAWMYGIGWPELLKVSSLRDARLRTSLAGA